MLWIKLIKNIKMKVNMTELFIQKNQEKKQIALVENGRLIEYYE